jgi:hypothetical protein
MSAPDAIEVQVWDPSNPIAPSGMQSILQGASGASWTDTLGAVGSGSVKCSAFDAKAAAVQQGSLIKFCLGGVPVFAFFNTSPVLEIGEAADSVITLAGTSALGYTARARVDPVGGWAAPTSSVRSGGEAAMAGTFGGILLQLITEAKARGTIPSLTPQFTATKDSAGNSWAVNCSALTFSGDGSIHIIDVILKLVALGMGVYMDPQLNLYAYIAGAYGADLHSTVIFQEGRHFTAPVDRAGQFLRGGKKLTSIGSGFSNAVLAIGAGNVYEEATDATVSNPYIGRWESAVDLTSVTGDTTLLTNAAKQQIALTETASSAITVNLIHDTLPGGYEPYVSCRPGDTIALNVPGQYNKTPAQIVAFTITQIDGANYTWQANLGSLALPIGLRVARQIAQAGGSTSTIASGTIAGDLTLTNPKGDSGPAFPLNPGTGFKWFRTDLGEWYYYDGTRWLSTNRRHLLFAGGSGIAATVAEQCPMPYPADCASVYLETMRVTYLVSGTDNGTNYWAFTLVSYSANVRSYISGSGTGSGGNLRTAVDVALNVAVAAATEFAIDLDKTLSPGSLRWSADVTYRRIAP